MYTAYNINCQNIFSSYYYYNMKYKYIYNRALYIYYESVWYIIYGSLNNYYMSTDKGHMCRSALLTIKRDSI